MKTLISRWTQVFLHFCTGKLLESQQSLVALFFFVPIPCFQIPICSPFACMQKLLSLFSGFSSGFAMDGLLLKLLLVFVFFNSGYFLDGMSTQNFRRPDVVNIGSIISFDSVIGKVAKVAMEAAIDDVNSNPAFLGGTKLKLTMLDANYSGFRGIIEALQLMETNTVAIIGPQSSVTSHVISHIANGLQVPLLSFAATDPSLSSLQYPFFVRTTQDDQYQMAAIADIVEYYEWREVVAIYTDDDYGRNGISALANQLATKRCRISYKAPMNPQASRSDIMDVMIKVALAESRILIVHTYPAVGIDVVAVAHHLGMIRSGYVWLATNWLSTFLETYLPLPSGTVENIQGLITLRMYTPDSEMKTNFLSRWKNLTNNLKGNGAFGLNTYGLYAYDTVWILATAINAFFNHGGNISFSKHSRLSELGGGNLQLDAVSIFDGGQLLLDSILKVKLTGLSGLVSFTSEKSLIRPAYEVINVIGTGIRRIGYWSNYSGLSVVPPEKLYEKPPNRSSSNQQLHSVMWPGQTTEKPRGWVFPNNGKQLRIGVPNRVSFHEFISEVPGTDMFKGYCIEVFTAALNLLPYAIPYKLMPFGDGVNNPSSTELVHLISTGVYDAAIGDIAITTNRTRMADFTQPYIQSGLVVVAPVQKLNAQAWAFLRPFTWKLWTVTGIFFLLVGGVIWFLEHRINDEFRGSPRRQILTILWFSFSTMFFSHREQTVSPLGRMVLVIWLFVVLIINSSYTASLTSILTVQQLSSSVKGIQSLIASKDPIGYQQGSFARNYLSDELGIHESRLVPLNSEEEYAKALKDGPKKGGVAAVVDERAYMELFLSSRCEFSIIGQEFTNNGWGFAFPQDSPLAIDMSNAILKLSEAGELQRIHDKWLMRSACSLQGASLEVDRIQLKSFSGLFIIFGLACLVALLVYFALLVCQFTKDYSESSDSSGSSSRSARIRTFLSFFREKEEEAKYHSNRRQSEQVPIGITGENESSNSSKKSCTAESSNRRVSFRVGTK